MADPRHVEVVVMFIPGGAAYESSSCQWGSLTWQGLGLGLASRPVSVINLYQPVLPARARVDRQS